MPMLRAVPSMTLIAASTSRAFRSCIFVCAISRSWSREMVPAFSFRLAPEPFGAPAAFLSSSDAGGVLVTKLKVRSSKIVISTGMTVPTWLAVRSLYVLTNSMMLMPYWPSAGPTGGAGVALPAGHWSLTTAITFFAMLDSFDLVEVEFDGGVTAEDGDQHLHLLLVRVHLFHGTGEVGERPRRHAHHVAALPGRFRLPAAVLERLEDVGNLGLLKRNRLLSRADEPGYSDGVLDQVPGLVVQLHLDQ